MKLLIDHNLPPWWADTLTPLCSNQYGMEVRALSKVLPRNTPDQEVFKFAKDGGWAILTQDKYRNRLERLAIQQLQIYAFNLYGWEKFKMNEQLGRLFRALPNIIDTPKVIRGGGVFFVGYKNAQVTLPKN